MQSCSLQEFPQPNDELQSRWPAWKLFWFYQRSNTAGIIDNMKPKCFKYARSDSQTPLSFRLLHNVLVYQYLNKSLSLWMSSLPKHTSVKWNLHCQHFFSPRNEVSIESKIKLSKLLSHVIIYLLFFQHIHVSTRNRANGALFWIVFNK